MAFELDIPADVAPLTASYHRIGALRIDRPNGVFRFRIDGYASEQVKNDADEGVLDVQAYCFSRTYLVTDPKQQREYLARESAGESARAIAYEHARGHTHRNAEPGADPIYADAVDI